MAKPYKYHKVTADCVIKGQFLLTYRDELFGPISAVIPHEDNILEFVCSDESMVCAKDEEVRAVGKTVVGN